MRHRKVGAVMTHDVVWAERDTPFKEVARLLADHRISGLPVVDDDDKVVGVISEDDLLHRQARQPRDHELPSRWHLPGLTRRARRASAKAEAVTAAELMTSPAVTVRAHDGIVEAARLMSERQLKRLPVVDEAERLVGIVSRRDLLRVFLRPDELIRQEILDEVVVRTLWLTPAAIDVEVRDGTVTLTGEVERRSEIPVAMRLTARVDGVVTVINELTYRVDDSGPYPAQQVPYGITESWIQRL